MLNVVHEGAMNPTNPELVAYHKEFKAKYPAADLNQARIMTATMMIAKAIEEAGSADDVVKIAYALEGMEFYNDIFKTKVLMREKDHQAIQNVNVSLHTKDIDIDYDNSGYGIKTYASVEMASADSPTTCKMKRP